MRSLNVINYDDPDIKSYQISVDRSNMTSPPLYILSDVQIQALKQALEYYQF